MVKTVFCPRGVQLVMMSGCHLKAFPLPPGNYLHLHKTTLLFSVYTRKLEVSFSSWLGNVLIIAHSLKWVDMLLTSEEVIYFESSPGYQTLVILQERFHRMSQGGIV